MNNKSIDATTPNNIANCNEYKMSFVTNKLKKTAYNCPVITTMCCRWVVMNEKKIHRNVPMLYNNPIDVIARCCKHSNRYIYLKEKLSDLMSNETQQPTTWRTLANGTEKHTHNHCDLNCCFLLYFVLFEFLTLFFSS